MMGIKKKENSFTHKINNEKLALANVCDHHCKKKNKKNLTTAMDRSLELTTTSHPNVNKHCNRRQTKLYKTCSCGEISIGG